jgi:dynein light intermediate chain
MSVSPGRKIKGNSPTKDKNLSREIKESLIKKQIQSEKEKFEQDRKVKFRKDLPKQNLKSSLKVSQKFKEEKDESAPQTVSLIKYDTPFLVSTTLSNKRILEELDDSNENSEIFLRNLINKRGIGEEKNEYDDFSVRDALNKILAPKKNKIRDQLWVQYVSCNPVTKAEVLSLQEELDKRLQTMEARETGICPIKEELYDQCFSK